MYLELWIFGIVGKQAIFEISCISIDPVTNLTMNSEAHSSPGKAQRKREIHSEVIVYIQLPGKKNHMVCLPFPSVSKQISHHHSQRKKSTLRM